MTRAAQEARIPRPKVRWVLQGPDKGLKSRPQKLNSGYAFAATMVSGDGTYAGAQVGMAAYPYPDKPHDRYGMQIAGDVGRLLGI